MAAEWRCGGGGGSVVVAGNKQRPACVCVCCVASSFRGHGDGAAVLLGRRGEPHAALKANPVL